jgi:hypothetical protein
VVEKVVPFVVPSLWVPKPYRAKQRYEKTLISKGENRVEMAGCGCGTGAIVGEEGLEPPTSTL